MEVLGSNIKGVKLDVRREEGIFRLVFRLLGTALIKTFRCGSGSGVALTFEISVLARFELGSTLDGVRITGCLFLLSSKSTGRNSCLRSSLQSSIVSTSHASLASLSAELLPSPLWPLTNLISA